MVDSGSLRPQEEVVGKITVEDDERPCVICYVFTTGACTGNRTCDSAVCHSCSSVGILCPDCQDEAQARYSGKSAAAKDNADDDVQEDLAGDEEAGETDNFLGHRDDASDDDDDVESGGEAAARRARKVAREEASNSAAMTMKIRMAIAFVSALLVIFGGAFILKPSAFGPLGGKKAPKAPVAPLPVEEPEPAAAGDGAEAAAVEEETPPPTTTTPLLIDPTGHVVRFVEAKKGEPCPSGSEAITAENMCSAAAAFLNEDFAGAEDEEEAPEGCHIRDQKVHLNSHKGGAAGKKAVLICNLGPAVPDPEGGKPFLATEIFLQGDKGMTECQEGAMLIGTEPTCKLAAKSLGHVYKVAEAKPDLPKGCVTKGREVTFNTDDAGAAEEETQVICKRSDIAEVTEGGLPDGLDLPDGFQAPGGAAAAEPTKKPEPVDGAGPGGSGRADGKEVEKKLKKEAEKAEKDEKKKKKHKKKDDD